MKEKSVAAVIFIIIVIFVAWYAPAIEPVTVDPCEQERRDAYGHGYADGYEDAYFKLTNDESPLAKEGNYEN